MKERNGVAYCASTFEKNGCPPRMVCAAPVFVPVSMTADELPLQQLYDHPDLIDLISAQEFGLEQSTHEKLLLCVVAAATPEALRELLSMVTATGMLTAVADCTETENRRSGAIFLKMQSFCKLGLQSGRISCIIIPARKCKLIAIY